MQGIKEKLTKETTKVDEKHFAGVLRCTSLLSCK
jgi:hypothetical protein